jgi:D-glycero-D-manno-heptose 1,7-bisphosphate phosphatase
VNQAAVFLDRDGTLIEEVSYLDHHSHIELFPWSASAVRALNLAGLRVVVTTNQSGIARGYFTEGFVHEVHEHIAAALADGGAHVDAYYYCPHHPDGVVEGYVRRCECRKPGIGMIDRAVGEFGIDPRQSFVIGDRWLDIGMARNAGARGILVKTGVGARQLAAPEDGLEADFVADSLIAAVGWILEMRTAENKSEGTGGGTKEVVR